MRAEEARALVDAVLIAYDQGGGRLLEWYPVRDGDRESCYLWSYFATTGMLYQAIGAGEDVRARFRELIDGLAHYRSSSAPAGMARYHSDLSSGAIVDRRNPLIASLRIWMTGAVSETELSCNR